MIKTVTITGADNSISPSDLTKLAKEFPYVEFAILVSPSSTGQRSRFPTMEWMTELVRIKTVELKLSLHLCGPYVNDFLLGNVMRYYSPLYAIWDSFSRVQINTHGYEHTVELEAIKNQLLTFDKKEFIFQNDGKHDHVLQFLKDNDVKNFSTLFDMSHGAGILPDKWPKLIKDIKCGYAGGIGPDNIAQQADKINDLVDETPTWIDMETKVMSYGPHGEEFNLNKVRDCLVKVQPFVK